MLKGDIILVPFPFTDLSGQKNRPAVILFSNNLDIIVAFISTQFKWKENIDIPLSPTPENGLKKKSLIRISKIMTLERSLVLGKLGSISTNEKGKLNSSLRKLLQLNH